MYSIAHNNRHWLTINVPPQAQAQPVPPRRADKADCCSWNQPVLDYPHCSCQYSPTWVRISIISQAAFPLNPPRICMFRPPPIDWPTKYLSIDSDIELGCVFISSWYALASRFRPPKSVTINQKNARWQSISINNSVDRQPGGPPKWIRLSKHFCPLAGLLSPLVDE